MGKNARRRGLPSTARALKASLMGRLVPLSRFCLLREDGLHYVEGIDHPDHLSGVIDPSAAADKAKTEFKMLWVDLEKALASTYGPIVFFGIGT